MKTNEKRELFQLIRKYQLEDTLPGSKLYLLCEELLDELWLTCNNQRKEQQR